MCTFTLAVNRRFANQQGEHEADFIDIVVWGKLAETCGNYLGKGRLAGVEGRLQIRSFETQDGQKRKAAEVVADNVAFLDKPKSTAQAAPLSVPAPGASSEESHPEAGVEPGAPAADQGEDDVVPF